MNQEEENLYDGREQSLIKHRILELYLLPFSMIVGQWAKSITYIDCFSGPWNSRSSELKDTSFSIALSKLREAKKALNEKMQLNLNVRYFFIEAKSSSFKLLENFIKQQPEQDKQVRNDKFENSISEIQSFIQKGGPNNFSFFFADPTGWKSIGMKVLGPLVKHAPCEVLVNFMTKDIHRFVSHKATRESMSDLFGVPDFHDRFGKLRTNEREDALVDAYCNNLKKAGNFKFVLAAIVLHPEKDRTHFHLIYATRNAKGVEVFKKAEYEAMKEMEDAREAVRKRKDDTQFMQFDEESKQESQYYQSLRDRYIQRTKAIVEKCIREKKEVLYDDLWALALGSPLVWEADLKEWLKMWTKTGILEIQGMTKSDRVPKRDSNHKIIWLEMS